MKHEVLIPTLAGSLAAGLLSSFAQLAGPSNLVDAPTAWAAELTNSQIAVLGITPFLLVFAFSTSRNSLSSAELLRFGSSSRAFRTVQAYAVLKIAVAWAGVSSAYLIGALSLRSHATSSSAWLIAAFDCVGELVVLVATFLIADAILGSLRLASPSPVPSVVFGLLVMGWLLSSNLGLIPDSSELSATVILNFTGAPLSLLIGLLATTGATLAAQYLLSGYFDGKLDRTNWPVLALKVFPWILIFVIAVSVSPPSYDRSLAGLITALLGNPESLVPFLTGLLAVLLPVAAASVLLDESRASRAQELLRVGTLRRWSAREVVKVVRTTCYMWFLLIAVFAIRQLIEGWPLSSSASNINVGLVVGSAICTSVFYGVLVLLAEILRFRQVYVLMTLCAMCLLSFGPLSDVAWYPGSLWIALGHSQGSVIRHLTLCLLLVVALFVLIGLRNVPEKRVYWRGVTS